MHVDPWAPSLAAWSRRDGAGRPAATLLQPSHLRELPTAGLSCRPWLHHAGRTSNAAFQRRRRILDRCSSRKRGASMSDRALVAAAGLVLMLLSVPAGWTQTHHTKLLVGRWHRHLWA